MYKIVFTFFLCLIIQNAFAQIPNAGFENWTSGNPDGWVTSNITGFENVTQSGTPHSGSSAVRGEVVSLAFGFVLQPVLQNGQGARGFAYAQRPVSIQGYYQFYPTSGDRFAVNVGLLKGGISGTHVGVAAIADPTLRTSYTQFTAPFVYDTSAIPDTCVIQFQIIGPYLGPDTIVPPHAGSYFLIDDLAFSGLTAVDNPNTVKPEAFLLSQNYPNPFNPSTSIPFSLSKGTHVKLRVFNILGGEVATLVNGWKSAGKYNEKFDASKFSSGVYFYRLDAENFSSMKQMLLIK
jgi:hypothetical protein